MTEPLSARAVLARLIALYPVLKAGQPLAIGINKLLAARHPEFEQKALRAALSHHTGATAYLKILQSATQRFDLEGAVAGEVTEEQRRFAADKLRERFRKQKEEKRAAEVAKQAAEAERQRAEKLGQLMEKFGRR